MLHIRAFKNSRSIVRIDIADEFCLHLELAVSSCPVLKCDIHRSRAKIRTADTDLDNCRKLLACRVCQFTCMNLVGERSNSLLLFHVKFAFIDSVSFYFFTELAACQMMKNQAILSRVDHCAVIQSLILLLKLGFLRYLLQRRKHLIVDSFRRVIKGHTACHLYGILPNALRSAFSCHDLRKINLLSVLKFSE